MDGDVAVSATRSSVWGDGYARDRLADMLRVKRWDVVSDDEFIFYFPHLVETVSEPDTRLVARLTECVAARAFYLRQCGEATGPLRSVTFEQIETIGRRRQSFWFEPRTSLASRLLRFSRRARGGEGSPFELDGLRLLDEVLHNARGGRCFSFDRQSSAEFAFFSGIHPAYFSASRLDWSCRDLAAGWLGFLDRGRSAVMPPAVAEFLVDVVVLGDVGRVAVHDPIIGAMVRDPSDWRKLRRAGEQALLGVDRPVRLNRGRRMKSLRGDAEMRQGLTERCSA